jgi:hypothetical protein
VGTKVNYSLIKDGNNKDIAIGLEAVERGVVVSAAGDTGVIRERATGINIDFASPRIKECNIVVGSVVKYEKVDFNGKAVATSVTLIR